MTIQYINTGTSANKGDGDTLRSAFTKINDNFRYLAQSGGFISTGSSTILSISPNAPSTATDGTLWFSSIEARTFVRYNGAWVDASPQITPPPSTSTETVITMSAVPPGTGEGTLWFNVNDARTYINYSGSWVDSSPQVTPPPILPANDIGVLANDGLGNLYWTTATGTSVDLTGYATEAWVNSRGFLTSSSVITSSGIDGIGTGGYFVTAAGSSNYIINGQNDPPLQLIRGYKYTFNVNAVGHPFWITTVNGAYNPANVYSTGVSNNGTSTGILTFTVPVNAPNTLYYVCQFHSAMIGSMTVIDVEDLIPTDISELSDNTNLLNSFTSTDRLVNGLQSLILTSTGTTVTPGSIIPAADLSYDLGSPTNQWRSLYVSTGTIYIGGVPLTINTTSNTLVIGTSTNTTATGATNLATENFVVNSAKDGMYVPANLLDWSGSPTVNTIQSALDELAARVTALQNYEIDGGNAYTPPQGELLIDGNNGV
jgi:hypothetical protein